MTSHLPLVRITTNHGYEFENSQFMKFYEEMGIKHEFSVSTTPQQNVVVERKKLEFLLRWLGDANRAGCSDGRKSTSGGVFYEGNNLVAWHSKK
ncbi:unnamed protein product [Prunus armeniaca]